MKKLLLVLFITFTLPSVGQSWAAPGATWYYDFTSWSMPFPEYGYERIQNIGDTIIAGKQYNKLQIYRAWFNQQSQQTSGYTVPQLEFTRADSGVVYYYRDSAEYVLYNFNAQPGETWVLRNEFEGTPCDTSSVVVDSIATTIINGDTLRVLRTSPVDWNGITFQYPRIVEKIGSLANLLPYTMCVTDIPQGYNLRCYSDSTGWMWQNPNWAYACDDIMSVGEHSQQQSFTVISDVQSGILKLNGSAIKPGAVIQVYGSNGQLLQEESNTNIGSTEIGFRVPSAGMYFVTVTLEQGRWSVPFVVVE